MKKTFSAALAAFALVSLAAHNPARADDENAAVGALDITGVDATAAKAGETTRVTFAIENEGAERTSVLGIALPSGERSRVMGSIGGEAAAEIGALPLKPGQRVEFGANTVWIEVGPLKADLMPGQRIAANLLIGGFEAPVTVHVTTPDDIPTGSLRKVK